MWFLIEKLFFLHCRLFYWLHIGSDHGLFSRNPICRTLSLRLVYIWSKWSRSFFTPAYGWRPSFWVVGPWSCTLVFFSYFKCVGVCWLCALSWCRGQEYPQNDREPLTIKNLLWTHVVLHVVVWWTPSHVLANRITSSRATSETPFFLVLQSRRGSSPFDLLLRGWPWMVEAW